MQRDGGAPREVHFVCADDAHGTPIMIAAEKEGITPQAFVAKIVARLVEPYFERPGAVSEEGPAEWVEGRPRPVAVAGE